jgi:hypothetical protein
VLTLGLIAATMDNAILMDYASACQDSKILIVLYQLVNRITAAIMELVTKIVHVPATIFGKEQIVHRRKQWIQTLAAVNTDIAILTTLALVLLVSKVPNAKSLIALPIFVTMLVNVMLMVVAHVLQQIEGRLVNSWFQLNVQTVAVMDPALLMDVFVILGLKEIIVRDVIAPHIIAIYMVSVIKTLGSVIVRKDTQGVLVKNLIEIFIFYFSSSVEFKTAHLNVFDVLSKYIIYY